MSNRKSINNNYKINIIFNSSVKGHVLEYVHNIYMHVVNREEKFIFLLPENFNERKTNLEWPDAPNVSFCFITNEEERTCNSTNFYASSLALCRCTRKYAKIFKADNVFFIFLIRPMPFLPFYLPHGTKASGIIYAIPIYKSVQSRLQKIKDGIIYKLYASKKSIKNVFLLNDPRSVEFYNKKYGTNKFVHLTDPIPEINMSQVRDLRKELNIPQENTMYLQIGSMEKRKNTLQIIRALRLMSSEDTCDKTFIFLGGIDKDAKEELNALLKEKKVQVIVKEGFVPYEYLNSMCYTSNVILTLYSNVEMSSGSIGYAAYFGKPVIGPSTGLLGNLIRDNNLGYTIDKITPGSIRDAFLTKITPQDSDYTVSHTVSKFCETILETLNSKQS